MADGREPIIAIDGLVGAGKSSTARGVASALGYRHLDTGAMYRCVTLAAVRADIAADDEAALGALLLRITIEPQTEGGRILLDGEDVSAAIRELEITRRIAAYADQPQVRHALVAQQQRMGRNGGVVAEGRDAGTVVFPDADVKVLMVADLEVRATRRHRELHEKGMSASLADVTEDIRQRDARDAARDYGAAHDLEAVQTLDTTELTLAQQIDRIVGWAGENKIR